MSQVKTREFSMCNQEIGIHWSTNQMPCLLHFKFKLDPLKVPSGVAIDFVGRMPAFSIDHVRSWKHDVRGCGQRMGGHHFMSLFTLSPSHIELPVASSLSLTRAHSLFFHHLIYLLHRVGDPVVLACYDWICHEFQTWHTYSGLIPHSSLWYFPLWHHLITFSDITFHYLWYSFSIFSFIIAYLTLSCFALSSGFSHVTA